MEDVAEERCWQELLLTDGEKAARGKASGSGNSRPVRLGVIRRVSQEGIQSGLWLAVN